MKICVFLIAFAALAAAQAPPAAITPQTVVAKTADGKDVTVADIQKIIAETPPILNEALHRDPTGALTAFYLQQKMAADADSLKLGEQSPWREQIEIARQNILGVAMMRYVADHYQVTPELTEAYYNQHINEFQQFKIKAIKIDFKPEIKGSASDLEEAAKTAFQAAHASTTRSEAEAKKIADDVVKQARGGTDFVALVGKYDDDQMSKELGGDFPPVKPNSMYPAEIKKAVMAMKAGEVSDPIRQTNCFYVIRVGEVSAAPINDVREDIIHTLRTLHTNQYVQELQTKLRPQIVRPDYFYQMDNAAGAKKN